MDSNSSEEVMFTIREKFKFFYECKDIDGKDKVEGFKKANFAGTTVHKVIKIC